MINQMRKKIEITRLPGIPETKIIKIHPKVSLDENLQILKEFTASKLLFSVKEASKVINVSDDFLYKRINAGLIHSVFLGGKRLIHMNELARVITEGV